MATRVISETLSNAQTTGAQYIFLDSNGDPSPLADTTYNPVFNVKASDGTDILGTTFVKAVDRITFYPPENGVTIAFHILVEEVTPAVVLTTPGATIYGKSTYDELIDVLLSDLPQEELKVLPPRVLMDWILRAEERICRLTSVREEFVLRYAAGVSDYALRNRPVISAATNATPIVVTCASHGITNNSRAHIFGGQGNAAVNGSWFTSSVATNTFTINPGAYISGLVIETAGLHVTTESAHGFSASNTITMGQMIVDIAGTHTLIPNYGYTITSITDSTNFIIATYPYLATMATYVSGGVAFKPTASVGSGAYSGGARVWLDSELPTYINKVISGSVNYGGYPYNVQGYTVDDLNREKPTYPPLYLGAFPTRAAIYTKGGLKYLRLDPVPVSSGDITIYGEVQITPKDHYADEPNLMIQLPSEYDPMILSFMKARAWERLGKGEAKNVYAEEFMGHIREHSMNQRSTLINIVYR